MACPFILGINMTETVLKIDENTISILNFIKNKYNMKDISEAITLLALQYEDTEEEIPDTEEYSPEFIKEMLALKNEPHLDLSKILMR